MDRAMAGWLTSLLALFLGGCYPRAKAPPSHNLSPHIPFSPPIHHFMSSKAQVQQRVSAINTTILRLRLWSLLAGLIALGASEPGFADPLKQASGPVGREKRKSRNTGSTTSSSPSPYEIHVDNTPAPSPAISTTYNSQLEGCLVLASSLGEDCPKEMYKRSISCFESILDQAQTELKDNANISTKRKRIVNQVIRRSSTAIENLRNWQDSSRETKSHYQCKAHKRRLNSALQGFLVDPRKYAPIQGKIQTPSSIGYGLSLKLESEGFWNISNKNLWLDWSTLVEFQTIPLKQQFFGQNEDVRFQENLDWFLVQPFSLSLSYERPPNLSMEFMDMLAFHLKFGLVYSKASLTQSISSHYLKEGEKMSEELGATSFDVMQAYGYHLGGFLFLPVFWHVGIYTKVDIQSFPIINFSNSNSIGYKVTFEDLQKNNSYRWYQYEVHLATRNTRIGAEFGIIKTLLRGAAGTGIDNRTALINLNYSWDWHPTADPNDSNLLRKQAAP
jgi:hypothetical protein